MDIRGLGTQEKGAIKSFEGKKDITIVPIHRSKKWAHRKALRFYPTTLYFVKFTWTVSTHVGKFVEWKSLVNSFLPYKHRRWGGGNPPK